MHPGIEVDSIFRAIMVQPAEVRLLRSLLALPDPLKTILKTDNA